jgi:hypothetical protein
MSGRRAAAAQKALAEAVGGAVRAALELALAHVNEQLLQRTNGAGQDDSAAELTAARAQAAAAAVLVELRVGARVRAAASAEAAAAAEAQAAQPAAA